MREKGTWTGRVIWEYMGMAMVRSVVVFLVFLTALAAIDSDWKLPSIHLGNGAPGYLQKTDKNTAEQLWCKKEILEISEEGPYLDFHSQVPSSENHSFLQSYYILLAKRSLWKAVSYLFFRDQQCILEENPGLHDLLNDDGSRTRFIKYKEFVSSLSSRVPRRSLRYKKHMRVTLESDPGHSPAPSPTSDSSGPSQEAMASSNSPVSSSPSEPLTPPEESPEQKPNSESSSVPSDAQEEPKETAKEPKGTSEEPKGTSEEPKGTSEEPNETPKSSSASRRPKKAAASSSGKNEDNTVIMVAIVGFTLAAILIVVIFLICSLKEMDENEGPRDEKPLIKIASSDTSAENPGKTDSQTLPTANNLSVGTEVQSSSATNTMATEATGAAAPAKTHAALPLPPGKSAPLPSAAPTPSPSSNPSSNPSPSPGPSPSPSPSPPPLGPAAPPPPKPSGPKAPAPPPPRARPPPNPPKPGSGPKPSPPLPHQRGQTAGSEGTENGESPKAKLKPFFWDKVNASPNHSMVWHEIRGGSFQFNEEMMESLFGYAQPDQNKNDRKKDLSAKPSPQFIQIIEPKKAQNLAILLKALNVTTEEVCDALKEGNELPPELVQTLLKMAPTADEELKLRLYTGDISLLGPADRFLKILIEIPFAFKRMESLLFMSTLQEEIAYIKESFATLEVACNELKNSRLFLKLLEAVLKTGNRMNTGTYRGGAQAFKLDTLLKLSDVKGTDGKTTLLHFVVQEIIRSEGIRAARTLKESHSMSSVRTEDLAEDVPHESEEYHRTLGLQVVSSLGDELKDVKKAAVIEGDNLTQSVAKLGHSLLKSRDFLNKDMMSLEEDEFRVTLCSFVEHADGEIPTLLKDEQRIMALVKSTGDYFHGKSGKDEGLRLFAIVRDFLGMLDKVCKEVEKAANAKSQVKAPKKETTTATTTTTPSPSSSQESQTEPSPADMRQQLFPAITARKIDDDFSSDDESTSS